MNATLNYKDQSSVINLADRKKGREVIGDDTQTPIITYKQLFETINSLNDIKEDISNLVENFNKASDNTTKIVEPKNRNNYISNAVLPQIKLLKKIIETWGLSIEQSCLILGFDITEEWYVIDILSGNCIQRGRDFKDRISTIYNIRKTLHSLFQDVEKEKKWLHEKSPSLDGKSPIDILLTGKFYDLFFIDSYISTVAGY